MSDEQIPEIQPAHHTRKLALLRTSVAFLGEKNQHGWWDCSFLNATGFRYLSLIYPKTFPAAALNAVFEAACRIHDERIGRGGVVHLFRLPHEIEDPLRSEVRGFIPRDVEALFDAKAALSSLDSCANGIGTLDVPGPVRIGSRDELTTDFGLSRIAAAYAAAFRRGLEIFPYFV